MFRPEHPVETARLTLRPFTDGDLDDLYAYQSRPDVARYLHWFCSSYRDKLPRS